MFLFRYDHLARVITKVLDERPENVVDIIEDFSKTEKRAKFTSHVDTVQDKAEKTTEVALAEIQDKLFKVCAHVFFLVNCDSQLGVFQGDYYQT